MLGSVLAVTGPKEYLNFSQLPLPHEHQWESWFPPTATWGSYGRFHIQGLKSLRQLLHERGGGINMNTEQ